MQSRNDKFPNLINIYMNINLEVYFKINISFLLKLNI